MVARFALFFNGLQRRNPVRVQDCEEVNCAEESIRQEEATINDRPDPIWDTWNKAKVGHGPTPWYR